MGTNPATVYIVDDDDAVRDSLRALIESYEFKVEDFASGAAFLARYSSELRGCVVLDMHLPAMSGLEILMKLRGERQCGMPVVIITGRSDRLTRDRLLAAGATAYFEKPVDSDQLLAAVRTLMAQQTAEPPLIQIKAASGIRT